MDVEKVILKSMVYKNYSL